MTLHGEEGEGRGEVTRVCINKPDLVLRAVGVYDHPSRDRCAGNRGKSVNGSAKAIIDAREDSSE